MAADVESLKDLLRDHCARSEDPANAAIGLIGVLAAQITIHRGARFTAEMLWMLGDRTVEVAASVSSDRRGEG
jgi:hypothetical protein